MRFFGSALFLVALFAAAAKAETAAERGYRLLTSKAYLPPDFDQQTFDEAWKTWPAAKRREAEQASAAARRQMAFDRYGLTGRPENPDLPLQYVVDSSGQWTMNCFACHGGEVAGRVIPGAPNSHFALATLTEDTRAIKLQEGRPLSRMDVGSVLVPLGSTVGTTNAVMFGVALMAQRDADLNVVVPKAPPRMVHHDMDPPPWWHFKKKRHIYIDGFAEKGHRALMQFMLVSENGPEKFREWEDDFRDVYAYLESLQPPRWPWAIDEPLAAEGKTAFNRVCAECHGTYGENASWPARTVPIDELATDRVRLDALLPSHRRLYTQNWFGHFGELEAIENPEGYVAPPLDGVWASGPYFHNGAVPTLWHVLRPSQRPAIWKRQGKEYDQQRVGLAVESVQEVPAEALLDVRERRRYFETRKFGKSAGGHTYPDQLSEREKQAVLEYLKTL